MSIELSQLVIQFLNIDIIDNCNVSQRAVPNQNSLFQTSFSSLYQIVINTLQNALNSASYIRHHRSSKSPLPFLYNQTVRKLEDISEHDSELNFSVSLHFYFCKFLFFPLILVSIF
jgi:hypothetical protein